MVHMPSNEAWEVDLGRKERKCRRKTRGLGSCHQKKGAQVQKEDMSPGKLLSEERAQVQKEDMKYIRKSE